MHQCSHFYFLNRVLICGISWRRGQVVTVSNVKSECPLWQLPEGPTLELKRLLRWVGQEPAYILCADKHRFKSLVHSDVKNKWWRSAKYLLNVMLKIQWSVKVSVKILINMNSEARGRLNDLWRAWCYRRDKPITFSKWSKSEKRQ